VDAITPMFLLLRMGFSIAMNGFQTNFNTVNRQVEGLCFTISLINSIILLRYDFKDIEINRLDNQILVRYFDEEWENYNTSRRCKDGLISFISSSFFYSLSRKGNSGSYSFVWHQSYLWAPIGAKLSKTNQQIHIPFNCGGGISG
jgi:hypothetical protein